MELGEIVILMFGQVLWFDNRMEKTLINLNQFQYLGIPICGDPTNQHRTLGIEACFNTHIPRSMVGSTYVFITRYLIDDNIDTC